MSTDDQPTPRGIQRDRPEKVGALASTVISVLRHRQTVSVEGLRQFVLDFLVRSVLSPSRFDASAACDELRGYRLSPDALIDLYVPAAARTLGERWVNDEINFAEVTVGTMRLQAVLDCASRLCSPDGHLRSDAMHILMVVPQGEQHFLGASVAAAQARRLGCDVAMSFDEDLGSLKTRIIQDAPDLVMITCARAELLESVAGTVQCINGARTDGPVVAVGGAFESETGAIKELKGVDIVTSIVAEAVAYCTTRSRLKKTP